MLVRRVVDEAVEGMKGIADPEAQLAGGEVPEDGFLLGGIEELSGRAAKCRPGCIRPG